MDASPIAIVGLSCRFAGAPDPGAFWRMLMAGRSGIAPLTDDVALPPGGVNVFRDRAFPIAGGQLGGGYSCVSFEQDFPRQLNCGENQDLYFITQLAIDALADAGLRARQPAPVRGSLRLGYSPAFTTAGINWLDHTLYVDQTMGILRKFFPGASADALDMVRGKLGEALPALDGGSLQTALPYAAADWAARVCSLSGAATAIDEGALSGLSALGAAADDLRRGDADVALAGAVSPPLSRAALQGYSGFMRFAAGCALIPFDRDSTGTLPGEGGAFFVLKRRADALAAHDRIYALLRAGCCSLGPAPLAAAADASGAPLSSIAMVEADGSGEPDEDAAEIDDLQRLWGPHSPGGPLVGVGSVKGNVGHCFTAASAAALAKTALSLHHRVLAPQMATPHPLETLSRMDSSVYLLDRPRPWITGDPVSPRRAAVLAHGVGGRTAAALLEEEPEGRT